MFLKYRIASPNDVLVLGSLRPRNLWFNMLMGTYQAEVLSNCLLIRGFRSQVQVALTAQPCKAEAKLVKVLQSKNSVPFHHSSYSLWPFLGSAAPGEGNKFQSVSSANSLSVLRYL